MYESLTVKKDNQPIYDIVISGDFQDLPAQLAELNLQNKRIMIVSETNVAPHYLNTLTDIFSDCAKEVHTYVFEAGEESKNLDTVQGVYEALIKAHFDRKDMMVALGGGVTGDLCGFAAATYLRGIDFIQIPTSLLSQVDSSIGGKTGVDFKCYKNMVGAFHMPKLVYINTSTLNTLTRRQFLSGMGEIIKHGLIKNKTYYEWLHMNKDAIIAKDPQMLAEMIAESCKIKRAVVEADPTEKGERALLNFGHTIGHAVEKQMNFTLLHGECVAIGMMAASYLSMKKGWISKEEYQHIEEVIREYELPVSFSQISIDDVLAATLNDKKMESGIVKFILLNGIGNAVIDRSISMEDMKEACQQIYKN